MVFINILTNNKLNAEIMKIKLFLLGFGLALSALSCYASDIPDFYFYDCESKFSNLTGYCQESLDVRIKLPKGFKDMALMGHYMQKSKAGTIGGGSSFRAIAKSADGECILLIPDEKSEAKSFSLHENDDCHNQIVHDVCWAANGVVSDQSYLSGKHSQTDMQKYVTEIDAAPLNADKAYLATLPLNNDTLMGKQFVSETVVYMQKSQRIPVKVTLLFTAKGLNDKDKHVDAALKSIAYGDKKDWKYDKALDKKAAEKYFASFYKLAKSNDARTKDGTLLRILSD